MLDKNIYKLEKPITYKIDTGSDVIPMEVVAIEFQDPNVGKVSFFMRELKKFIKKGKKHSANQQSEVLLRGLGSQFDEISSKVRENKKEVKEDVQETTPQDILDFLYEADLIAEFERNFDKILVNDIGFLLTKEDKSYAITEEFLKKLGIFDKEQMILSFLGFFSRHFK